MLFRELMYYIYLFAGRFIEWLMWKPKGEYFTRHNPDVTECYNTTTQTISAWTGISRDTFSPGVHLFSGHGSSFRGHNLLAVWALYSSAVIFLRNSTFSSERCSCHHVELLMCLTTKPSWPLSRGEKRFSVPYQYKKCLITCMLCLIYKTPHYLSFDKYTKGEQATTNQPTTPFKIKTPYLDPWTEMTVSSVYLNFSKTF